VQPQRHLQLFRWQCRRLSRDEVFEDSDLQGEEALAVVAQKDARREALQRAFKASGKTVPEFAEMYGLALAEAQKLLA
jgi:hypothetical protein